MKATITYYTASGGTITIEIDTAGNTLLPTEEALLLRDVFQALTAILDTKARQA